MLHGKHIFAYGRKSLFSLFRTSRAPWPHKALKVHFSFCCKIAVKRCFPLVDWNLFFCVSSLGLFFIECHFRASFFAFFKFCYTSLAKRTVFNMRSGAVLAHFRKCAFHCRRIAKKRSTETANFHLKISELQFRWPELQKTNTPSTILRIFRHFQKPFWCFPCSMESKIMIKLTFKR